MKDIAKIFGCSTRTIVSSCHISCTYTDISGSELDRLDAEINTLHSNCGEKSVKWQIAKLRLSHTEGKGEVY